MVGDVIYNFDYFYYVFFLPLGFGIYKSYPTLHILLIKSEKYKSYDRKKQYYIIKN